jgi:XTP/dITP diphosphohydrolase
MKDILIVTRNRHKFAEISSILPAGYSLLSLNDINFPDDIEETASTLEGNARLKAKTIYDRFSIPCFADDTGLEVEALGGMPGVFSARYAGPEHDFEKNIDKLLAELRNAGNRNARFRTVICLLLNSKEYFFEGVINGTIITSRRGNSGFGYDPVFIPDGYNLTFAEMTIEDKNAISHRAIAVRKMADFLSRH